FTPELPLGRGGAAELAQYAPPVRPKRRKSDASPSPRIAPRWRRRRAASHAARMEVVRLTVGDEATVAKMSNVLDDPAVPVHTTRFLEDDRHHLFVALEADEV